MVLVAGAALALISHGGGGNKQSATPEPTQHVKAPAPEQVTVTKPTGGKAQPPAKTTVTKPKPASRYYKLAWKHKGPGSVKVMVVGKNPRNLTKPAKLKAGTRVQLTAAPGDGWFYTWGGSCHGSNLVCTLSMTQMKSVNAIFKPNPVIPVTASSSVVVVGPAPTTTLHPDPPPKGDQPPTPDNTPATKNTKPGSRKLIPPPLPLPPPTTTEGG